MARRPRRPGSRAEKRAILLSGLVRLSARRVRGWNQGQTPGVPAWVQPPSGSHYAARLLEGLFAFVACHLSDRAFPRYLTGRVVDTGHKGRGYELTKGKYVEIDEGELKAVRIRNQPIC